MCIRDSSQSTISLRITAIADSGTQCDRQIDSAVDLINRRLGDLVFGVNGVELDDVVAEKLAETNQTIAIIDFGFGGSAAADLFAADTKRVVREARVKRSAPSDSVEIEAEANSIRESSQSSIGVAISATRKTDAGQVYDVAISNSCETELTTLRYTGHSGLRASRTRKQILNQVRLFLSAKSEPLDSSSNLKSES